MACTAGNGIYEWINGYDVTAYLRSLPKYGPINPIKLHKTLYIIA